MSGMDGRKAAVLDERGLWTAAGNDLGLVRDRVERFLKDSPRHLAEMAKAMDVAGRRVLEREARALRGSAERLGGRRMADAVRRLEEVARSGSLQEAGVAYAAVAREIRELQQALAELLRGRDPDQLAPGRVEK